MKLNPKNWNAVVVNNILQFVFIFSSVYFAFWLTDRREQNEMKRVEQVAIRAVYEDLKSNLQSLYDSKAYHDTIMYILIDVYDSVNNGNLHLKAKNLQEVFSARIKRKSSSLGIPSLHDDSWHTFSSTAAFLVMEYEISNQLHRHSRLQTGVKKTSQKLVDFFMSRDMYSEGELESKILQLFYLFRELNGQEISLITSTEESIQMLELNYDLGDSMTQKADTL